MDSGMGGDGLPLTMKGSRLSGRLPGASLLLVLLLFYLPLAVILSRSLFSEGRLTGENLIFVFSRPLYGRLILFTLAQAFLSALVSLAAALPCAALFVHYDFPLKKLLLSSTTLSFILPPILVVLGFVIFWGNRGTTNNLLMSILNRDEPPLKVLYSFRAIILAHAFYNIPLALRFFYNQWAALPRSHYEAARLFGASRGQMFGRVIWPRIAPAAASSFLIIFLYCFMSFAIILVLGGGPRYSTLEVEIYRLIKFNLDFSRGSALALVETLFCLIAMLIYLKSDRGEEDLAAEELLAPAKLTGKVLPLFLAYLLLSALFFGGPMIALIGESFRYSPTKTGAARFSLHWYGRLFSPDSRTGAEMTFRAVRNSLYFALWTTAAATLTGTAAAFLVHRKRTVLPRLTELLLLLPMGISSLILALGYLFLSTRLNSGPFWDDLSVIMAHTFIALPFVYRSVGTALAQTDGSLRESALIQGAGELQTLYYIELPLLAKPLITGALFAFALSMGEINAVLILSSPERVTIPIAIYRLIGSYNYPGACAMGTLLILLSLGVFFIMNTMDRGNELQ
ncbi:MAG: iron ABC transporter permease [Spirochaetales bacterium]|nr:iron ABC transporter permease [Spirochaetales bacterium]